MGKQLQYTVNKKKKKRKEIPRNGKGRKMFLGNGIIGGFNFISVFFSSFVFIVCIHFIIKIFF